MTQAVVSVADELEELRKLKARYCRFLDTKDVESDPMTAPQLTTTSAATATGVWAMEDLLIFGDGRQMLGAGHYHETYVKMEGSWRIKSLHLTRTILRISGSDGD